MISDAAFVPLDPRGAILGDEVYRVLGEAILDGRLAPGERLRDVELAERLGVSRTPVREALQRLERIGMVHISANRWTRVSRPDDKVLADTREFVAYTMGNAVRLAVSRCSDAELAGLVAGAADMIEASAADDARAMLQARTRFFGLVTQATENAAFKRLMREAEMAMRRNVAGWRPANSNPITRTSSYVEFRDAVAARDSARAEAILRAAHGVD